MIPTIALLMLAIVGLVMALIRPWDRGTKTGAGDGTPTAAEAQAQPEVPKALKMVIGDLPEGFELQWLQDPEQMKPEEMGVPNQMRVVLLAKPDAKFGTGGWVAITTRLLDRFERARFDPANDGSMQTPRKFALGEYQAAAGKTWEGFENLVFGPVNDGFAVSVSGVDLNQASLTEIAGLVSVDDDGKATLRDAPVIEAYTPLGVFENVWGIAGVVDANPQAMISVSYTKPGVDSWLSVSNSATTVEDPLAVARFFLKDPVEGTVHGQPAIAGDVSSNQPAAGQPARIHWIEDGHLVTLNANKAADELFTLAESTRIATDEEWATLVEEWKVRQEEMNQGMNGGEPTWLIGAGDMEDASTWTAEGAFTEEGEWVTSSSFMSSDGSGMSSGGGGTGEKVEFPHIAVMPQQMGMPGTSSGANLVIGLVDEATADGAILRFTPAAGSDGEVIEVAVRQIRDDWPAWAAALAVPLEQAGVVELIGADGTVLTSEDIEAADDGGGVGEGGDAPAGTAAAAVGG